MSYYREVIWDAYGLHNPFSGIANHAQNLLAELLPQQDIKLITDCQMPHFSHVEQIALGQKAEWSRKVKLLWNLTMKRHYMASVQSPAIIHGLSNFNIFKPRRRDRCILTVHDLTPQLAPHMVSRTLAMQLRYLLPKAISLADRVICVSQWTLHTCEEQFPQFRNKLTLIPNGFHYRKDDIVVPRETSLNNVCFISRYEKYKGFERLVQIIHASPQYWRFYIITDKMGRAFLQKNLSKKSANQVQIYCSIDEEDMEKIIRHSALLLHTSLYEGFCLPAAEALSLGRPVVFLKGSGIDEVVGCGGIGLQNYDKVNNWIDAMGHIFSAWRQDSEGLMVQINEARHKLLPWRQVAHRTLNLYNELQD